MTETTQTSGGGTRGTAPESPYEPYTPRSPEARAAMQALRGMREDLIHDAFAYRPLPRLAADSPRMRKVPPRLRRYAVWTPHAMVAGLAWFTLMTGLTTGHDIGSPTALLGSAVPAAVVLLTLVRPVAAFWLSLASTPVITVIGGSWDGWPWPPGSFVAHVIVMTIVAMRTRPRAAAWMWLVTAAYGLGSDLVTASPYYDSSGTAPMLVVSAFTLLLATVFHVRREAAQEVTAQQTVTQQERSRRTLLEERTTIARELHDVVAHHMSVVAIQAEAAPYRVENPPPELERAFATIRENAVAALTELRRVLGVVRAEDYEAPDAPQPTLAELDALLANVRDAGLTVEKAVTGAVRELPQGVELSAYRIVQEALSNVLRHAPGASARVEIGYVLGGLGVRIVNGPPPSPGLVKPSPGAGHGLTGMRERVTMLGGEMATDHTPDGGFEVAVFLPVALANEAGA
ncbi:sensor histidine kinase [Streptomyces sp. NPDC093094]|uniref:sensor histidine kinase n=1 Tax=Streptomyces sp. NPDC093094 TaxID=3366026 RepID=UPI00381B3E62